MDICMVKTSDKTYPIYLEDTFDNLADALAKAGLQNRRAVIVTDSNVAPLYLDAVKAQLGGVAAGIGAFVFPAGEESKTLATIGEMYACFMDEALDRKSFIVALGGGVTGDMAGFAAATYMRGIPFVQIPTTLLSQVDSSVGGKTGVDFRTAKNIIGAFYQPELVYINTSTLRTLPREQVVSGMGEVVKHGLILDAAYFAETLAAADAIAALDTAAMQRVVNGSCRIKASVVAQDEKESGLREILNYGHTFGHAVESLCRFALPHGHCVALGMVCAMRYAVEARMFAEADMQTAVDALTRFGLPTQLPAGLPGGLPSLEDVYTSMLSDKKTKNRKLHLVLPTGIGTVRRVETEDKTAVLRGLREIYGAQSGFPLCGEGI